MIENIFYFLKFELYRGRQKEEAELGFPTSMKSIDTLLESFLGITACNDDKCQTFKIPWNYHGSQ